jgi:hypothetical protein
LAVPLLAVAAFAAPNGMDAIRLNRMHPARRVVNAGMGNKNGSKKARVIMIFAMLARLACGVKQVFAQALVGIFGDSLGFLTKSLLRC